MSELLPVMRVCDVCRHVNTFPTSHCLIEINLFTKSHARVFEMLCCVLGVCRTTGTCQTNYLSNGATMVQHGAMAVRTKCVSKVKFAVNGFSFFYNTIRMLQHEPMCPLDLSRCQFSEKVQHSFCQLSHFWEAHLHEFNAKPPKLELHCLKGTPMPKECAQDLQEILTQLNSIIVQITNT